MKGIEWCFGTYTHRWRFPFKFEREYHPDFKVILEVLR